MSLTLPIIFRPLEKVKQYLPQPFLLLISHLRPGETLGRERMGRGGQQIPFSDVLWGFLGFFLNFLSKYITGGRC